VRHPSMLSWTLALCRVSFTTKRGSASKFTSLPSILFCPNFLDLLPMCREHLSVKEWIDLLLNVEVDVSSGTLSSGWDDTLTKRMARAKFVQTVLLTANHRTGIWNEKGFVWSSASFLPIFEVKYGQRDLHSREMFTRPSPLASLRCPHSRAASFCLLILTYNSFASPFAPSNSALLLALYGDVDQVSHLVRQVPQGVSVHTADGRSNTLNLLCLVVCNLFHCCNDARLHLTLNSALLQRRSQPTAATTRFFTWQLEAGMRPWCVALFPRA
jgi:hypothetical protein